MLRGFFGNLIFAIIARMLCGNHLITQATSGLLADNASNELCLKNGGFCNVEIVQLLTSKIVHFCDKSMKLCMITSSHVTNNF